MAREAAPPPPEARPGHAGPWQPYGAGSALSSQLRPADQCPGSMEETMNFSAGSQMAVTHGAVASRGKGGRATALRS